MIGRLSGTLLDKNPPEILVDVNGVGYEVQVPMSTYFELPAIGAPAVLVTHLVVREDAHLLFGFLSARERTVFRELIRIAGVGPRMALAVLSGLSIDELISSVEREDAARLQKVPGVGKKTAERLLLELRGRLSASGLAPGLRARGNANIAEGAGGADAQPDDDPQADISRALLSLGYSDREVQAALKTLPAGSSVSDGIRHALKQLARGG